MPAVRRVRRVRGHQRAGGHRGGPRLPRPARRRASVDTLVLGCTHYPLLTGAISYVMGDGVTLVSSAEETAKDVYRVLADTDVLRPPDLPPPTTASPPPVTPRSSPASPAGSSGPRWAPTRRGLRQRGRAHRRHREPCRGADEAHRRRLLRVVRRAGFARVVLPGRRPSTRAHLAVVLDLGNGALGPLQRLRRPGRRSTRSSSATCTPTTASTSAGSTSPASTAPAAAVEGQLPVHAPAGAPRSGSR